MSEGTGDGQPRATRGDDPASIDQGDARRRRPPMVPVVALLGAMGAASIAWALTDHIFTTSDATLPVPLVTADARPFKVRPADPGGIEVPDRGRLIYQSLSEGEAPVPDTEQLLPPPEEPVAPPEPEAIADAAETLDRVSPAAGTAETPDRASDRVTAAPAPEVALEALPDPAGGAPAARADEPAPMLAALDPAPAETAAAAARAPEAAPPRPRAKPVRIAALSRATRTADAATRATGASHPSALSGRFLVQLVASRSEPAARAEWRRLSANQGAILGRLSPIVVRADNSDTGTWYRLRAGPFTSRAGAEDVCRRLKTQDVGCFVVAN